MRALFILFSILTLTSCMEQKWEGFVYPNQNDLTNHIEIEVFTSLEECRDNALAKLEELSSIHKGDYECALNCKEGSLPKICEKTEQ